MQSTELYEKLVNLSGSRLRRFGIPETRISKYDVAGELYIKHFNTPDTAGITMWRSSREIGLIIRRYLHAASGHEFVRNNRPPANESNYTASQRRGVRELKSSSVEIRDGDSITDWYETAQVSRLTVQELEESIKLNELKEWIGNNPSRITRIKRLVEEAKATY